MLWKKYVVPADNPVRDADIAVGLDVFWATELGDASTQVGEL